MKTEVENHPSPSHSSWEISPSIAVPAFNIVLFPEEFTSKVAKISYREKHQNPQTQASIDAKWQEVVTSAEASGRTPPFNGNKAILYIKPNTPDDDTIKIVAGDYKSFIASTKLKDAALEPENPDAMRKHFLTGVIIVCVTNDEQIIVGSRDANWNKDRPETLKAQFPAGFIDPDSDFYAQAQTQVGLKQAFLDTGLKELREEVLDFREDQIGEMKILGGIVQSRQWPSKSTGTKDISNFKSVVVQVKVNMSFEEIMEERIRNPPKDADEMTVMTTLPFNIMAEIKDHPTVLLEGNNRDFIAEHAVVPAVIAAAQNRQQTVSFSR